MSNLTALIASSIKTLNVSEELTNVIFSGSKTDLIDSERELLSFHNQNALILSDEKTTAENAQVADKRLDVIDAIQSLVNARFIAMRDADSQAVKDALACTTIADHALNDVAQLVGKAGERAESYLATLTTADTYERAELGASAIAAALSKVKLQAAIDYPDVKSFADIPHVKKAISASEYFRDLLTKNTGHKVAFSGTGLALTLNQCRVWVSEGSRLDLLPSQGFLVTRAIAKPVAPVLTANGKGSNNSEARVLVQSGGTSEPVAPAVVTEPVAPAVVTEPVADDVRSALQPLIDLYGFEVLTDTLVTMELATLEQTEQLAQAS